MEKSLLLLIMLALQAVQETEKDVLIHKSEQHALTHQEIEDIVVAVEALEHQHHSIDEESQALQETFSWKQFISKNKTPFLAACATVTAATITGIVTLVVHFTNAG